MQGIPEHYYLSMENYYNKYNYNNTKLTITNNTLLWTFLSVAPVFNAGIQIDCMKDEKLS